MQARSKFSITLGAAVRPASELEMTTFNLGL